MICQDKDLTPRPPSTQFANWGQPLILGDNGDASNTFQDKKKWQEQPLSVSITLLTALPAAAREDLLASTNSSTSLQHCIPAIKTHCNKI